MIVWIMLVFYVFVMFIYFIPTESKLSFEKLDIHINKSTLYQSCTVNSDCNNDEKCFNNKCYPTYRGTNYCNPFTGTWVLESINGLKYLKCTCRHANIVTQKFEGANCDVDIACAPNGQLKSLFIQDISQAECLCKKGFQSLQHPQIGCRKVLPSEIEKSACNPNEIHISQATNIFHTDYLNNLPIAKQCLKNPCGFNVFNSQPLKNTKFDPKYGCICNPTFGNFGVTFDSLNKYLITEGYDACGNIFKNEPSTETKVQLYTYFYINGEPPKSFIQFTNLNTDHLVPELQNFIKDKNLQIDDAWPFNYSQYIFQNENFAVHTRECYLTTFFEIEYCNERIIKEKQMINCDQIIDQVPKISNRHLQAYALLYKYPVCKYTSPQLADLYKNRYILNPYLLSYKNYRRLLRSNGIEMYYDDNKWMVNFAAAEFDKYEDTSVFPQLKSLPKPYSNYVYDHKVRV